MCASSVAGSWWTATALTAVRARRFGAKDESESRGSRIQAKLAFCTDFAQAKPRARGCIQARNARTSAHGESAGITLVAHPGHHGPGTRQLPHRSVLRYLAESWSDVRH